MRVAFGLTAVAAILVAGAMAAPTATVRIADSSLSPARVRVDAGGSVTWRNAGSQAHRVSSTNGAFAAFTLAPRGTRTVRFSRNGRHPYRVDGRRCGVVFVGVRLGAGCSPGRGGGSGSGGPRRPPSGTRTYRYDVTLRGEITNQGGRLENGLGEERARSVAWSGTIRNVRVTVTAAGATFFLTAATSPGPTAQWREQWRWIWVNLARTEVNCEGEATQAVPLQLLVNARNGRVNLLLQANGPPASQIAAARAADCGRQMEPIVTTPFIWRGMEVEGDGNRPFFELERATGALAFPVAELATGRAFSLDTGRVSSMDSNGFWTITQRYVVRFAPRR